MTSCLKHSTAFTRFHSLQSTHESKKGIPSETDGMPFKFFKKNRWLDNRHINCRRPFLTLLNFKSNPVTVIK